MINKGKFITIEGGDGAGKSTQLASIEAQLHEHSIDFVTTREPGGTALGEQLRAILLQQNELGMSDDAELLLMFAARAEHVNTLINPALSEGKWVVSDRFADASFAYQGARGLPLSRIQGLDDWVLKGFKPDLTLLFDLPIEQGLERVNARGALDRFEQESLDYKRNVQKIYLDRAKAEPDRIKRVDSSVSLIEVTHQVNKLMRDFIQANLAK